MAIATSRAARFSTGPESKGIETAGSMSASSPVRTFSTGPESKGIETYNHPRSCALRRSALALKAKGLRQVADVDLCASAGVQHWP